jgi:phytanoyl-CoA hydroxylase
MYIFKSKRIGGEVPPHTDNIYIRSKPLSCVGLWVAFDDATIENGCMWGIPGSHKTQTSYFLKASEDGKGERRAFYEPPYPPAYNIKDPVPLEAEKGTVVILNGDFVHFSYNNISPSERHAYTLHTVESKNHIWEEDNWLQRKNLPFRPLFESN